MKAIPVPLVQVGNSRGISLPARLIAKHKLERGMILEERGDESKPASPLTHVSATAKPILVIHSDDDK